MIKYVNIPNYTKFREAGTGSHFYQSFEETEVPFQTILVHAYECHTKIFKGYLFSGDKKFVSVPLLDEEKKLIEEATGEAIQLNFMEFVKGTIVEDQCSEYTEGTLLEWQIKHGRENKQ